MVEGVQHKKKLKNMEDVKYETKASSFIMR